MKKQRIFYVGERTEIGKQYDRYFDKNGVELFEGDEIVHESDGRVEKLYLTDDGSLGTDATNPDWVASGKAQPCEYGIYPLYEEDLIDAVKYDGYYETETGLRVEGHPEAKRLEDAITDEVIDELMEKGEVSIRIKL